MGNTHDSPAKVAIAGLLAGMLGAVAVSAIVALGRTVMGGSDKPGDPCSGYLFHPTRRTATRKSISL